MPMFGLCRPVGGFPCRRGDPRPEGGIVTGCRARQDGGLRRVGSGRCARRAGPVDRGLLDGHVGVQVGVGAGGLLVTEPNDGDVDPGLQQAHGRGVTQRVHGHVLSD